MTLEAFAANERSRAALERTRSELAGARSYIKELEGALERTRAVAEVRAADTGTEPAWLTVAPVGEKRATLCTVLSDLHLDEVVRPSEVGNINAYDRKIAEARLERYFDHVIMLSRSYLAGVEYDGVVLMLGGDLVSGSIHEELAETNEAPLPATIKHWVPLLAAGIRLLAEEFGKVHVASVVGNHGRLTKKSRAKLRAFDNADWLIAQLLAERFADDPRVTFDVPDGTDALVHVYRTTFLLTHGDQATGGGGIGGIWPPLMRLKARKQQRYLAQGQGFDWMVMGHWHQYVHGQGLIVNGSLKGYDEYAAVNNFPPERAQQALWVVTPEHGVTWAAPVFCDNPRAERRRRK